MGDVRASFQREIQGAGLFQFEVPKMQSEIIGSILIILLGAKHCILKGSAKFLRL